MKHSIVIYIYMSMSQLLNTPLSSCAIYLSKNLWKNPASFPFFKMLGGRTPESAGPLGHASTRDSSSTKGNARRVTGPASVGPE